MALCLLLCCRWWVPMVVPEFQLAPYPNVVRYVDRCGRDRLFAAAPARQRAGLSAAL